MILQLEASQELLNYKTNLLPIATTSERICYSSQLLIVMYWFASKTNFVLYILKYTFELV
jgi:hypothetical protein